MSIIKINSQYRRDILTLLGYYWCIPCAEEKIKILVKLLPRFESEKKFIITCKHMMENGLIKKEKAFVKKGNKKDCYMLTKEGRDAFEIYGRKTLEKSSVINQREDRKKDRQTRLRIVEAELFFLLGTYDNTLRNLMYISKDTIVDSFKQENEWESLRDVANSRMSGVLFLGTQILPIYNVKENNILIVTRREQSFFNRVANFYDAESLFPNNKIILADSLEFVKKVFEEKRIEMLQRTMQYEISGQKTQYIFPIQSYRNEDKVYFFENKLEQTELVELFAYDEPERNIKNYIIGINYDKVNGSLGVSKDETDTTYYGLATYETNDEVGFEFIQQELHKLLQTAILINEYIEKDREPRKIKIYGLKTNRQIYDLLFDRFPNTEFIEIKKDELIESFY